MAAIKKGLVLWVHGSRDPSWSEPFNELLAETARELPGVKLGLACLQFGAPDLETAVGEMVAAGIEDIVIVPGFFGSRGHVLRDLPKISARVSEKFTQARIIMTEALGDQPEVQLAFKACLKRLSGL